LDQQNTSLMQALPGMDFVAKSLMGESGVKKRVEVGAREGVWRSKWGGSVLATSIRV
jgi:hypothetical protein